MIDRIAHLKTRYTQTLAVGSALIVIGLLLNGCEEFQLANEALIRGESVQAPTRFVELGTLGGNEQFGTGINESNVAVGIAKDENDDWQAFRWTFEGGIEQLDDFGGNDARALGINDLGAICGSANLPDDDEFLAVIWDPEGNITALPTLEDGRSLAFGINNMGEVAGMSTTTEGNERAVMWTADGEIVALGTLGIRSQSNGINNRGEVVGFFVDENGSTRAFLWTFRDGMQDIGTLGGNAAEANAIDDLGRICGRSNTSQGGPLIGFITTPDGEFTISGTLGGAGSQVLALAENGLFGGVSANSAFAAKAYLGIVGEDRITQLPDFGVTNGNVVRAVNNNGILVGSLNNTLRRSRAVMWQVGQ